MSTPTWNDLIHTDVVVVGAGGAGLWTALVAADEGAHVVLVSRSPLAETASYWAQGGLAAAMAREDSPEKHLEDTLSAGRNTCRLSAARVLSEEAPARIRDLERFGVHFDRDAGGNLALGLEGGHSLRRVVHAGGTSTGRRLTRELSAKAANHPRIQVVEGVSATGLRRTDDGCAGIDTEQGPVQAAATVLATGGTAALWIRTTNPPGATGTGIAMAYAAGAVVADLELIQFHPTALVPPGELVEPQLNGFLISEAVRGEGARLLDSSGERFVDELAPRDVVARAVLDRMRADRSNSVWLDMRELNPSRFPNLVAALDKAGLDPLSDLIPVSPAAHYAMGGIATDLDGRSSLPGLFAVGECACTGLHGANRLASNSLSECFVFGRRAGLAAVAQQSPSGKTESVPGAGKPRPAASTRKALWRHAGLERNEPGLRKLLEDPHPLAALIAKLAIARTESRGVHFRTDYPNTDSDLDSRHVVICGDRLDMERWD